MQLESANQEAEEGAERGELAPQRRWMEARVKLGQKGTHLGGRHPGGLEVLTHEGGELPGVGQVGPPRVRRGVALRSQVEVEAPDRLGEGHSSIAAVCSA